MDLIRRAEAFLFPEDVLCELNEDYPLAKPKSIKKLRNEVVIWFQFQIVKVSIKPMVEFIYDHHVIGRMASAVWLQPGDLFDVPFRLERP